MLVQQKTKLWTGKDYSLPFNQYIGENAHAYHSRNCHVDLEGAGHIGQIRSPTAGHRYRWQDCIRRTRERQAVSGIEPSDYVSCACWRAKIGRRFRLFFRYDSRSKVIIYAWVNDENTLRSAGSKSDPYAVFEKMPGRGNPPDDWDALITATRSDWNEPKA